MKVTTLDGYSIALEKSTEPTEGQNGVGIEDVWTLIFTDQDGIDKLDIEFLPPPRGRVAETTEVLASMKQDARVYFMLFGGVMVAGTILRLTFTPWRIPERR